MEQQIFSVSQVNQYLKAQMDQDPFLGSLCVRGEISNYKRYPSGHHYFSLKDAEGALRCVLFRGSASRLRFQPENGMKVLAFGRISVFPRDGAYQLYCEQLTPDGVGDLHVAFEQLKEKLAAEGLFSQAHKKPLPRFPHRVALVTSGAGAAVRDMIRILRRRYPLCKVLLLPVRVQGAEAPAEISGAIRYANRYQLADVMIVGRGGGSMEDLWAFNDERVARAIYESQIPVVSAVGHEPDFTISDFVADVRAATPSNGAELAAPDQLSLRQKLKSAEQSLQTAMRKQLEEDRRQLQKLAQAKVLRSPRNYYEERRLLLDYLQKKLALAGQRQLAREKNKFLSLAAALDAMSPLKVLSRGYAIAQCEDGALLKQCRQVAAGSRITVRLQDGSVEAEVTNIREEAPNGTVEEL